MINDFLNIFLVFTLYVPKGHLQTLGSHRQPCNKHFLYRKSGSQFPYSFKNTRCLILSKTRIFVQKVNNNKNIFSTLTLLSMKSDNFPRIVGNINDPHPNNIDLDTV